MKSTRCSIKRGQDSISVAYSRPIFPKLLLFISCFDLQNVLFELFLIVPSEITSLVPYLLKIYPNYLKIQSSCLYFVGFISNGNYFELFSSVYTIVKLNRDKINVMCFTLSTEMN